ncbi:unnamed protein product [Heligmosomoides polygyrus]|uniref:Reverse transcriptase domain-containing protein n=1 Tax=Heligmosomoides polygyrus TaxID=6339 RepID=A0A3P8AHH3_HELPZ|nr:unnamed protein product [Heligmosomoides polygyrus]
MKIYERLFDSRLREMVPISQVQWGFMPERSTTDAIFIAPRVMEKYWEKRKPCYLAFLDLEKAYDRLARAVIWNALRGRGVPERLITVIRDMYEGDTNSTRGDKESGHHSGTVLIAPISVVLLLCIIFMAVTFISALHVFDVMDGITFFTAKCPVQM